MPQIFSQYIDQETCVVKKPDGWDDPFGDGVWRSSWFYASLLIIKAKDPVGFDSLCAQQSLSDKSSEQFLKYFSENCLGQEEWSLPKNPTQKFSGDQLAPLLFFLSCVGQFGSDLSKAYSKSILTKLVDIDRRLGAVSDSHQGQIRDNQRYAIDFVCRMFDVDYLRGFRRENCKIAFTSAVIANNAIAQLPWQQLATNDAYSVFNALGLVTAACIKWGSEDGDVDSWRKNYRVHADKGWGLAFRIVAGRSISDDEIADYLDAYISRDLDNDIIMAQRPAKFINGEFFPDHRQGVNRWLVLDYLIQKGLQLLWGSKNSNSKLNLESTSPWEQSRKLAIAMTTAVVSELLDENQITLPQESGVRFSFDLEISISEPRSVAVLLKMRSCANE